MVTLTAGLTSDLDILLQETSLHLWRILGLILLAEPAPLLTLSHPPGTQSPVCLDRKAVVLRQNYPWAFPIRVQTSWFLAPGLLQIISSLLEECSFPLPAL